ncbi:MAG: 4-alpha-glucanotransferase [Victivallales bacterium]|nr:4-alpha-glucanotransferase [Victivallales bacterium]
MLPITALPSRFGIGDVGPQAFKFAEFLRDAGQSIWQVLPLTATDPGCGNSPYSPTSAFAGNHILISPEALIHDGLLSEYDLRKADFGNDKVDYDAVIAFKDRIFRTAWKNFKKAGTNSDFLSFTEREADWIKDYALFTAIKKSMDGKPWHEWPHGLKFREPDSLKKFEKENKDDVMFYVFLQYVFASQMARLREGLKGLDIELIGDVPVYVTGDCADV